MPLQIRMRLQKLPPYTVVADQALVALVGQTFPLSTPDGHVVTAVAIAADVEDGWLMITAEVTRDDPETTSLMKLITSQLVGPVTDWDHDVHDPRGYKPKPPKWDGAGGAMIAPSRLEQLVTRPNPLATRE